MENRHTDFVVDKLGGRVIVCSKVTMSPQIRTNKKTRPLIRVLAAMTVLFATCLPLNAGAAETGHDAHHDYHPNLVAVFAGFTGEVRKERSLSLGLEYFR